MARAIFDDVDKLILEKWSEVTELVDAHRRVREKIEAQFDFVCEQLRDWAAEQELDIRVDAKAGEFYAYSPQWLQPGKQDPWASLAVGGFVLEEAFGSGDSKVYAAVYCSGGKKGRPRKDVFGASLRAAISPDIFKRWSVDTDRSCPLNMYVDKVSAKSTMLDPKQFESVVLAQFNLLSEFVDAVSISVKKMSELKLPQKAQP